MARRTAQPEVNWDYVNDVQHFVSSGEGGLEHVPSSLKRLIESGAWRSFMAPMPIGLVEYGQDQFPCFVSARVPRGLGASDALMRDLLRRDPEALDLYDRACQRKHGGDRSKIDNVNLAPTDGNSETYALRRLRGKRPDLHARVLARQITAHAAMIEAGFRRRTITVPLVVELAAASIKRHFAETDVARLKALL